MRRAPLAYCIATAMWQLAAIEAQAANAAFQSFFFTVCNAPAGTLATRCAETPGALGNLSGDSESSLNPSQNLSHNQAPVSVAQTRSKEARERGEKLREGEPGAEPGQTAVAVGPVSLLVNVHGTSFDRKTDPLVAAERGFEGDSYAAEAGIDYRVSERTMIGAIGGVERTRYDFDAENAGVNFTPAAEAGDADADNVYLTLFASWSLGTMGFVELSAGYEVGDGSYQRHSVFQESTRTLPQVDVRVAGDTDGTVTWASLNAGFDIARGAWSIGPFVGATRTRSELEAYTERDLSGSGLAMHFDATSRDSLLGHVGLRTSYTISTSSGVLVPQLRLEYQHEFEDDPQTVTSRFTLDPMANEYQLSGDSADKDALNAGLSLAAILQNGWMAFFDLSVLMGNDGLDRERYTLGLRKEF